MHCFLFYCLFATIFFTTFSYYQVDHEVLKTDSLILFHVFKLNGSVIRLSRVRCL